MKFYQVQGVLFFPFLFCGLSLPAIALDRVAFCVPSTNSTAGSQNQSLCDSLAARNATQFDSSQAGGVFTSNEGLLCLYSNHESAESLQCGAVSSHLVDDGGKSFDSNPWLKTRQLFAGTGRLAGKYKFKPISLESGSPLEKATQTLQVQAAQLETVRSNLIEKLENYRDTQLIPAIEENLVVSQRMSRKMSEEYLPALNQIQILNGRGPALPLRNPNEVLETPRPQIVQLKAIANHRALPKLERWGALKDALLLSQDESRLAPVDRRVLLQLKKDLLDQNGILAPDFLESQSVNDLARAMSQRLFIPLDQPIGLAIRGHLNHVLAALADSDSIDIHETLLGSIGLILGGISAYESGDRAIFVHLTHASLKKMNAVQLLRNLVLENQDREMERFIFEMLTAHKLNGDFSSESTYALSGFETLMKISLEPHAYIRMGQKRLSQSFIRGCILIRNLELSSEIYPVLANRPDLAGDVASAIWDQFEVFPVPQERFLDLKHQMIQSLHDFVRTH